MTLHSKRDLSYTVKTPIVTRQEKKKAIRNIELVDDREGSKLEIPFREKINTLLNLTNFARPDIAYAVKYLSRRQLTAIVW